MSSDILRRAAAKLRETAAPTTPAPWADYSTADDGAWPRLLVGAVRDGDDPQSAPDVIKVHESVPEDVVSREDLAWIALTSPAIAEPLAAWLEMEAWRWDAVRIAGATRPGPDALAVARALLGETPA
jgi:hypothetical protein